MPFGTKVVYKGYTLKSKHEYAWARYFDARRIPWEYEPIHFRDPGAPVGSGLGYTYTPDFGIQDRSVFIEIKVYDGAVTNKIHFCTKPLIAIYGTPERCYMHVKQAGASFFERGHSLNFDLALARLT